MRQRLYLLVLVILFWLAFHIITRGIFLVYNVDYSSDLTAIEIAKVFWNGFRMDMSISGYVVMFTSLLLSASFFITRPIISIIINFANKLMIVLSSIVVVIDLELYRHWGFRLDMSPFIYLTKAGAEAVGSVQILTALKLLVIFIIVVFASIYFYQIIIARRLKNLTPVRDKRYVIVALAITGLFIIPIRGSFTVAPMNSGFVYFHKTKTFANHAAINVVWNFLYALQRSGKKSSYPEDFYDKRLAEKQFQSFYPKSDTTIHIFNAPKPNVILFILESFTSSVIGPLGGLPDITPNLNRYCHEGILFDNFYASGDRTDKGLVNILSAYPAQNQIGIVNYPNKAQHLTFLNRNMNAAGYNTSFVYGGDIDFGNFRSYLTNSQFDQLTTLDDFDVDEGESKWGIHDHIVFEHALEQCDTTREPFFKTILSLSSHEPFDVPLDPPFIKTKDEESLFLNSCYYTDKSIGTFVENAKKSAWWKNSVIIFVADHGHRFPGEKSLESKERFHIPLLMIGGAINKDSVIHTIGSQTDIANTLLAQIDSPSSDFPYSKNLLSPTCKSFAFYFFNNGYGYVTEDKYIVHDNTSNQFTKTEGASKSDLDLTKAYQQTIFSDYNAK
jgi:phosphoglycerol transferase MdoB-like AlkP superfamily enzyme